MSLSRRLQRPTHVNSGIKNEVGEKHMVFWQGIRTVRRFSLCFVALVSVCFGFASRAKASPWVLQKGHSILSIKTETAIAGSEFLGNGNDQAFPLNGRFISQQIELRGRYGLFEGFEVALTTNFKAVSYTADPVLLPGSETQLPGLKGRVFDFANNDLGWGDTWLAVTTEHAGGSARLASEFALKLPMFYDGPTSTFSDDIAEPDRVLGGEAVLGDGRVALRYRLQFGYYVAPAGLAVETSGGYNVRFDGPGHQALAGFKVGKALGKRLFFTLAAESAFTVFKGDENGKRFIAIDPSVPAAEFTGDNVRQAPFRLDFDFVRGSAGFILRLGNQELTLTASHTFWGKNFAKLTAVELGVILPFVSTDS